MDLHGAPQLVPLLGKLASWRCRTALSKHGEEGEAARLEEVKQWAESTCLNELGSKGRTEDMV